MEKALIIPIPKCGVASAVSNYRPISLRPLPGKMLEKLIHTQLNEHFENKDHLTDSQFGFWHQRSTTQAITHFVSQVYTNINRSAITTAVYIDFRKAFDCVQHSILLNKLGKLNFDQSVLTWITDYFSNRMQRTLANDVYSDYRCIT